MSLTKPMDKLKVLAFSDCHGDRKLIASLHQRAVEENVDLVLICGDYSDYSEEATEGLIKKFLDAKKPVAILSGNHESTTATQLLADFYGVTHLHGKSTRYKGVGIFGCGGTANIGPHWISEEEMMRNLCDAHAAVASLGKKIMVTHEHPADSVFELGRFPGSESIRQAITRFRPDILVCGHIHEAEGVEEMIENTRVLNVSKKGRVFEL